MKRDCNCPRATHEHGTYLAYAADNCHCVDCKGAWAAYRRRQIRRKAVAAWGRPLYVPPQPSMLRLQALALVGWGAPDLAPLLNAPASQVLKWRTGGHSWLYCATADRIAAVYDEVWDKPPPGRYAVKVRRHAAKHHWAGPMMLDDDLLDCRPAPVLIQDGPVMDEIAVQEAVHGRHVKLTKAERAEAVRLLTAAGYSATQIAERLRVTSRTVQRRRAA